MGVFEPAHEIMVLFVLRKLILQTRMYSNPLGLDDFSSTAILHVALPSLVAYVISTIMS